MSKRTGLVEDVIEIGVRLPWGVSVALGVCHKTRLMLVLQQNTAETQRGDRSHTPLDVTFRLIVMSPDC
jgi:hypothetical protein